MIARAAATAALAALIAGAAAAAAPGPAVRPAAPAKAAAPKTAPAAKPAPAPPARGERQPVTVDADRMERFGRESLVIFIGNVVARHDGSVQHADRMEVYLDEAGERIVRSVSTGNVRIVTSDCKTGTARRSEYYDLEQRVVLIGNARVWQDDSVVTGETITMFIAQDRSVVEGGQQERVKAVFYRRDGERTDGRSAQAGCTP
jgi:lipopolysaccharide export system protein LptA